MRRMLVSATSRQRYLSSDISKSSVTIQSVRFDFDDVRQPVSAPEGYLRSRFSNGGGGGNSR